MPKKKNKRHYPWYPKSPQFIPSQRRPILLSVTFCFKLATCWSSQPQARQCPSLASSRRPYQQTPSAPSSSSASWDSGGAAAVLVLLPRFPPPARLCRRPACRRELAVGCLVLAVMLCLQGWRARERVVRSERWRTLGWLLCRRGLGSAACSLQETRQ